MNKILLAAAGALATVLSFSASAQGYIGGGIGAAKSTGINGSTGGVTFSGDATKTSWKLLGGYQFNANWGLEAQYSDLGNRTITGSAGAVSGSGGGTANQWSLAGTGTLPLSGGFSLMAKLGASRNKIGGGNFCVGAVCAALGSTNKTDLLAGIGVGYAFSKNIAIRAEYENFGKFSSNGGGGGGAIKADNWGLSLIYSF